MDRPVSVDELHELVPAAQEEDLLEELAHERVVEQARADVPWAFDETEDEPPAPAPEEPEEPLRPGQVLGLLEHQLGARVIEPDEPA